MCLGEMVMGIGLRLMIWVHRVGVADSDDNALVAIRGYGSL